MERAGMVLGLTSILFGAGCLLSPPLAGWMADTTHTYRLSFIVAAAAAALSMLFLLPMRKNESLSY
jgi:MFS family permease